MSKQPDAPHVDALTEEFIRSGIAKLHVRTAGIDVHLSRNDKGPPTIRIDEHASPVGRSAQPKATADAGASKDAAPALQTLDIPDGAMLVVAPYLGTFYRSPKPGSAAYVELGARVEAESEMCLVEVMKLFTAVRAGHAGTVVAILASDGELVTADQPLFAIEAG